MPQRFELESGQWSSGGGVTGTLCTPPGLSAGNGDYFYVNWLENGDIDEFWPVAGAGGQTATSTFWNWWDGLRGARRVLAITGVAMAFVGVGVSVSLGASDARHPSRPPPKRCQLRRHRRVEAWRRLVQRWRLCTALSADRRLRRTLDSFRSRVRCEGWALASNSSMPIQAWRARCIPARKARHISFRLRTEHAS